MIAVVVVSVVFLVMIFVMSSGPGGKASGADTINVERRVSISQNKQPVATSSSPTRSETPAQTSTTSPGATCKPLFYVSNLIFNDADFTVEIVLRANVESACVIYVNKVFLVDLNSGFNLTLLSKPSFPIGGGQAQYVPLENIQLSQSQYFELKNNYNKENYNLIIIYVIQQTGVEETDTVPLKPREFSPIL